MDNKTLALIKRILSMFPKHELLGLKAKIIDSTDKTLIGRSGIVINETKNTLQLRDKDKAFIVEKKNCVFEFLLGKERIMAYRKLIKSEDIGLEGGISVEINGKLLCGRPEERIKKKLI